MNLKFLIVGLGSMGKRRVRNLLVHNQRQIIGYDIRPDRMEESQIKYGIKTIPDLKQLSDKDYDALIISTPPDQHGDYIRMALKNKKHFFVEHPTSDDGYDDIEKDKTPNLVKAPSCTLCFYMPIKMIKEILDSGRIGKILAFQYHMGQYLPDWHPWEDYRQVYFSKKETGACREMLPFELIWLSWVMDSAVSEISGSTDKISDLDMDADDIFLAQVKYNNGIMGNVIIDVISRKPFRTLRVLGSNGVLEWERFVSVIKVYDAKSRKTENIIVPKGHPEKGYVNEEEMYNDEIGAFLDAVEGKKNFPHTFADSHHLLKALYALEKSSETGKVVSLKKYDKKINIGGKIIGPGQPVFIVAEAGVNHNGSLETAKRLIDAAADAGADAVKFQTFTAELLVTKTASQAGYQAKNIGKTESQSAMLKRLELPRQWHAELRDYCEQKEIIFLSTPFSEDDADFLESINVPAFKIPSGEVNNFPYLEHLAKKGKPIILSTGMSNLDEVKEALKIINGTGNKDVIVLHCTSNYPASSLSLNLRAISTLQTKTGVLVGYSDHSVGHTADVAAAVLGACIIEKHFTLDKNMEGPDHKASLNPEELRAMVKAIREVELMLGNPEKRITADELSARKIARKSIVSKKDIFRGVIITRDDISIKRPGNGIPPARLNNVIGKKARVNIKADKLIKPTDLI